MYYIFITIYTVLAVLMFWFLKTKVTQYKDKRIKPIIMSIFWPITFIIYQVFKLIIVISLAIQSRS
jgi:hypothetical protein